MGTSFGETSSNNQCLNIRKCRGLAEPRNVLALARLDFPKRTTESGLSAICVCSSFSLDPRCRTKRESSDLAFKVFLSLRLVKPTKSNFDLIQIQFKGRENAEAEIFSLTHPQGVGPTFQMQSLLIPLT